MLIPLVQNWKYVDAAMPFFKPGVCKSPLSKSGLSRDLNPGPLAPKARIIPLDHWAAAGGKCPDSGQDVPRDVRLFRRGP